MNQDIDIRWKQRFENYEKAFGHFKKAVSNADDPSDLEKAGVIQYFEFTHELAWKVIKDFLEYEGITGIIGSRSATRCAFNKGLITNGQIWMDMIESRNKTVHAYRKDILEKEYTRITENYFSLFEVFLDKMKEYI